MSGPSKIEWTERTCSKCRTSKTLEQFKVDCSRALGRAYVCNACCRVSSADTPTRGEREKAKELGRGWCRECRAWFDKGPGRQRWLCRAHLNEIARDRYAADPVHRSERKRHARVRKRGVEPVPPDGCENLLHQFDHQCAYCDRGAETWDHVVAVSKGGLTEPGNILPSCIKCNSSKKDRDIWEWLGATGRDLKVQAAERLAHYQVGQ